MGSNIGPWAASDLRWNKALSGSELSNRLLEIAKSWLDEAGMSPEPLDPEEGGLEVELAWQLLARVSEDWSLQLVQPAEIPDKMVVGAATNISDYHRERMQAAPPEIRRHVFQALNRRLRTETLDLTLQVEAGEEEHPTVGIPNAFLLRTTLYADGLTKTGFFRTLRRAHNVRLAGVDVLQSRFGTEENPLNSLQDPEA